MFELLKNHPKPKSNAPYIALIRKNIACASVYIYIYSFILPRFIVIFFVGGGGGCKQIVANPVLFVGRLCPSESKRQPPSQL